MFYFLTGLFYTASQPIVAPNNIKRYFISPKESGELCLLSCILGKNRDIFFPKLTKKTQLQSFDKLAVNFLNGLGYEPLMCSSEEEARELVKSNSLKAQWPCYFSESDTTGEKLFEEFYTSKEKVELTNFKNIGVIKNQRNMKDDRVLFFKKEILKLREELNWSISDIVKIFKSTIEELNHIDTGKFLDDKM